MELSPLLREVESAAERLIHAAVTPSFAIQAAAVVILFLLSRFLAGRIEPRLEQQARRIKGQPGLLRIVIAVLRRITWLLFALLLLGALTLAHAIGMPDGGRLLSIVLSLSLAWLFTSVLSRIIHNRLVARTIGWLAWIYAAVVILGIDAEAGDFLDSLAINVGAFRLSALVTLKAVLLLVATVWIAVLLGNFIDVRVQRSDELSPSLRVLIGKFAKIGLVVVAGAVALSSVGIDLTALTIFSGAVGVGLGFGLQKVVSNFTSGIIILLDKSIKPGDTITVGDTFGWIRELRARFVSVVTRDGREYLIPNETFSTERVINWSFTDELVRLDVHFGVSYEADPHEVSRLAIEAAAGVGRVEAERRPVCWITGFGESSVDYVLRFWIHDPQQGLTNVRGKVFLALWDTFKANGVEIPFPQRDVTIRNASELRPDAD